jgi:methylglutaconyl-CoA hydratase
MNKLPEYQSILIEIKGSVAYIYLNRPDKGNSVCEKMIEELYDAFQFVGTNDEISCVVVSSKGEYFCLGPDMDWLKNSLTQTRKESLEESLLVGKLLFMIYTLSKPVICLVNGYAAGGGVGLISVCDIVVAGEDTEMVFDEVKYGFTPLLYAPYVIKKIGESKARELFLTGRVFKTEEAKELGLINYIGKKEELSEKVDSIINELITGAPKAIGNIKDILSHLKTMRYDEVLKYTAECVADLRASDEVKEGVLSKIEKRKPNWLT